MWRTVSQSKQVMLALLLLLIGMMGTACTDGTQRHVTPTPTAPAAHLSLTPAPPAASVAYVTGFTTSSAQPTTYFVAALNTTDGSVRWRYAPADFITGTVAVGDVVLFKQRYEAMGTPTINQLVALNASDGSVRWTHVSTNLSQFIAQGNAVYIGTNSSDNILATSSSITSLDIRSGAVRWRKTLAGAVGRPMIVGSLLYAYISFAPTTKTGTTSEIVALDSNTGKQQWLYTEGSFLQMPEGATGPLVIGNRLYMLSTYNLKAGEPLDDVVALDAYSGSLRWRSTIGGRVIGLATDGNAIYLSAQLLSPSGAPQSPEYEVEALRVNDGQTLWNIPFTYAPSVPVLGNNEVFITATGPLIFKSSVDRAQALRPTDGRALWRIPGTVAFSGDNPTTDGNLVYVVTYRLSAQVSSATPFPANTEVSLIKAIRAADGQPRWETPLSAGIYPLSPVVTNGKLFVTFISGGCCPDLAVLDAASGSILWRFGAPSSEITSLALPA